MARLQRVAVWAAILLASATSPVAADDFTPEVTGTTGRPLSNTYIVELEDGQASEGYLEALRGEPGVDGVTRRFAYRPSLFNAVSFEVEGTLTATPDHLRRRLAELPDTKVKHVWPVEVIQAPKHVGDTPPEVFNLSSFDASSKRPRQSDDTFPPHEMIQVDRLHAEGFSGNGTRIGIVDTGIDWRHPALGGCFGPGCLVEYGHDLVGDEYDGTPASLRPDDDPYEVCHGHGTLVAGVIAAKENALGFVGAAPGATLGVYRVFGCSGASSTDVMIAAILRAYEDGSDIITMSVGTYTGWAAHPLSVVLSRVSAAGVPCVAAAGNAAGAHYGLWSVAAPSTGEEVMAVGSVESTLTPSINGQTGQVTWTRSAGGGLINGFSLWGPTFEGNLKPQFSAPGGNILTTAPNGYTVTSGTSLAAPITAASIALLFEARGKLPADEVRNLLASTAKTVPSGTGTGIEPVAHQGAGIIQVHDAAHATTGISVSGLAFNDTDFLAPRKQFEVTNDGDTAVEYTLGHVAALTVEALWPNGYRRSTPEIVAGRSSLTIEPASFTLQPGAKAAVRVSIALPDGLEASNLPVYGGFVSIDAVAADTGTNSTLSIPYLGTAGAMRGAEVLAVPEQFYFYRSDDPVLSELPARVVFQLPAPAAHPDWARPVVTGEDRVPPGVLPGWGYWIRIGSPEVRFELVPVAPSCRGPAPALHLNVNGDETLGPIDGFPARHVDPQGRSFAWTGRLADGSWAPPGRYRMRLYALRHLGDRSRSDDWSVLDFKGSFGLSYVDV